MRTVASVAGLGALAGTARHFSHDEAGPHRNGPTPERAAAQRQVASTRLATEYARGIHRRLDPPAG